MLITNCWMLMHARTTKITTKVTILAAFTPQTAKNRPAADMTDMSAQ
jgi:hypothetical protein